MLLLLGHDAPFLQMRKKKKEAQRLSVTRPRRSWVSSAGLLDSDDNTHAWAHGLAFVVRSIANP